MFVFKGLAIIAAIVSNVAIVNGLVLDVPTPKILEPSSSTVWTVGGVGVVSWDVSTLPAKISNPIGTVLLGTPSNILGDKNPLATGFSLKDGSVKFTVPNVAPGDDYIVTLIGDSGDHSATFKIVA